MTPRNTSSTRRFGRSVVLALAALTIAGPVSAQWLPSEPVRALDGRLIVGGETAATTSVGEDIGFFNYTDYEHNALRMLRLAVNAELRAGPRVALLAELRTENMDTVEPYAWYVRIRPWTGRTVDVQAGRIPPAFGAFPRRHYAAENPLIGTPLAYQYLTALRADALPATPDDLTRMRGRGWLASYPLGNATAARGLPLVNALRWDTGVQARVAARHTALVIAFTSGSPSSPSVGGSGSQVSGRVEVRPVPGATAGFSMARGGYLSEAATDVLRARGRLDQAYQRVTGIDLEYSSGYWLIRSETVLSSWDVPIGAMPATAPLTAVASYAEVRYRVHPRWYVAARVDRLTFSHFDASVTGASRVRWEAPVSRIETGIGWYLERNLVAKAAYQHNWRDSTRERTRGFLAGQINWWF